MNVNKAVITAAGPGQEQIPLQTLIDRGGKPCSTISVQLDELQNSGISDVAIVINEEADEAIFRKSVDHSELSITFVKQKSSAKGFGQAILAASDFVEDEAFLLMVGDHIYVTDHEDETCAEQLIKVARREECLVSAVQPTHESNLRQFGTIGGQLLAGGQAGLFEVNHVKEKPTPTYAEQHLLVPGQRLAHYLCFFGMHVITPAVMKRLRETADALGTDEALGLSDSLDAAGKNGKYLAVQLKGRRFDLEQRYGQLKAQIAIGLHSPDRDRLLAEIVDLLTPLRSNV